LLPDEVGDDLDDQIIGQGIQMELNGVCDPEAAPVVIELDLDRLVLLVDIAREEVLDPLVLGERDMRTDIEHKASPIPKRSCVSPVVRVLVVHDGPNAFGMKAMCSTKAGHPGSDNYDIRH
jgi:hypothetical protein